MGRTAFAFDAKDERFVEALVRYGASAADVARELGIDDKTLAKHFGSVIEVARARRNRNYLAKLFEQARAGSARAAIKLERMSRRTATATP